MKDKRRYHLWLAVAVIGAVACGGDSGTNPTEVTFGETTIVFVVNPTVNTINDTALKAPGATLDGAFILGVGRTFADAGGETLVPLGLSLGRRIVLDGNDLQLTPYVQPTVIFQSDSAFGFGLGLDIHIRGIPDIRLNWAEGDLDGFAVSLFWAG